MIKVIAIDMDGTFLDNNRRVLHKNIEACRKAAEKGVMIVVSTGSPYTHIPFKWLKGVDIPYAIIANGAAIYLTGDAKCIYEECIPADLTDYILDYALNKDVHIDLFIGGIGYSPKKCRSVIDKLQVSKARYDYLLQDRTWIEQPIEYIKQNDLFVQKISMNFYPDADGVFVDKDEMEYFVRNIKGINFATSGYGNFEITKEGVDKGTAMEKLCERIGISISEVMAIGDSLNDLGIIKKAGFGVAMGNAAPEVKENADYVTLPNYECGVAYAINEIFMAQS